MSEVLAAARQHPLNNLSECGVRFDGDIYRDMMLQVVARTRKWSDGKTCIQPLVRHSY